MLETICDTMVQAYKNNWITSRDGNIINSLLDQSDNINRMISNVRQVQRDLQL